VNLNCFFLIFIALNMQHSVSTERASLSTHEISALMADLNRHTQTNHIRYWFEEDRDEPTKMWRATLIIGDVDAGFEKFVSPLFGKKREARASAASNYLSQLHDRQEAGSSKRLYDDAMYSEHEETDTENVFPLGACRHADAAVVIGRVGANNSQRVQRLRIVKQHAHRLAGLVSIEMANECRRELGLAPIVDTLQFKRAMEANGSMLAIMLQTMH